MRLASVCLLSAAFLFILSMPAYATIGQAVEATYDDGTFLDSNSAGVTDPTDPVTRMSGISI